MCKFDYQTKPSRRRQSEQRPHALRERLAVVLCALPAAMPSGEATAHRKLLGCPPAMPLIPETFTLHTDIGCFGTRQAHQHSWQLERVQWYNASCPPCMCE